MIRTRHRNKKVQGALYMCFRARRHEPGTQIAMALSSRMFSGFSAYPDMAEPPVTAFGQSWNQGTPSARQPAPRFVGPTEDHMRDSVSFQEGSNERQVYTGNMFIIPPWLEGQRVVGSIYQGMTEDDRHQPYQVLLLVRAKELTFDQLSAPYLHVAAYNYLACRNWSNPFFNDYITLRDSLGFMGVCQTNQPTPQMAEWQGATVEKIGAVVTAGGKERVTNIWQADMFQLVSPGITPLKGFPKMDNY